MATSTAEVSKELAEEKRRSLLVESFFRLIKEKPLGVVGGIITLVLFFTGIFANWLAPYGYNEIMLGIRLSPPIAGHILGADHLGRDLLSRIIYGARVSMIVGLSVATLDVLLATLIGGISGYFGGKFDIIAQRFVDGWMCFPPLFIVLTFMAVLQPGIMSVILVLGIFSGIRSSRVVRSAVLGIKENVYIGAARAIGAATPRMLLQHVLPNVMAPIIIIFTIAIGAAIITEASISFLGFGIPPPLPSWGGMLSESGRRYLLLAPWMAFWPGLALSIVVYGINMLGDAMRDILDPRLRGGLGRYGGMEKKRTKRLEQEKGSPA